MVDKSTVVAVEAFKMDAKLLFFLVFSLAACAHGKIDHEKVLQQFASAANKFGVNLYRTMTLASEESKNIFISPLSIYAAFAMVNAGARGQTSYELQKVLNWNELASPGDILDANRKIKIFKKAVFGNSSPVSLANKLWLQKYFCTSVCKKFVKLLQENYDADLGVEDFAKNPEAARSAINKWVASKTANKIQELLEPGTVRSTTRLVLTNAVYFKRNWKYQFDKSKSAVEKFHVSQDSVVDAKMMKMTSVVGYTADDNNLVIELPYTTDAISMVIILPQEKYGIKRLEASFSDAMLRTYIRSLRKTKVDITLPKFKIKSDIHLKDYLSVMGVRDLFDPFQSDLSGIYPSLMSSS